MAPALPKLIVKHVLKKRAHITAQTCVWDAATLASIVLRFKSGETL